MELIMLNRSRKKKKKQRAKRNRNEMKKILKNDLTEEQWKKVLNEFGGTCAFCGHGDKITKEHMIPVVTGHGELTTGNIIPMESVLNSEKSNENPFVWIKKQNQEIQRRFYKHIVPYLAKENKMSPKEYEFYVKWCFEHQRTRNQVIIDNKLGLSSKDVFYRYYLGE